MSFGIQLSGLRPLVELLRRCSQPQFSYEWQEHDRFYTRKVATGSGRQKKTEYEILVWLPDVESGDGRFKDVFTLVSDPKKKLIHELPISLEPYRAYTFVELLQAFPLSRTHRRRKLRQNLIAAVYGGNRSILAEVFGAAPKNPNQKTSIVFLDEREDQSPDLPRYLIRLPQADPQFHWPIWLETENRRLEETDAKVKLFHRLGEGASAEFYVEHGWAHPLPEVVDLYPNEQGANPILIEGERDGKADTRWIPIISHPADSQVEFQTWDDTVAAVELQWDGDPELALTYRPSAGGPLQLTPHLEELSRERREGLQAVEARIRGAQKLLFQLEQQRTALSAQQQSRFRMLLVFEQPRAEEGQTPALAHDFQRFLLMSRRQLDKFDYVFLQTEAGPDQHVVVTREPVFWQDVHTALASEIFYQPLYWTNWATRNVFVKHGFVLVPAIDDQSLAEGLGRLVAARGGSADKLVLIEPGQDGNEFRLRITPQATSGGLASQLTFLNRDYPVAEFEARGEVRKELLAALQKCQVDLEAEVQNMERKLKEQAALRLDRLHGAWNDLAPKIDSSARHLEHCQDKYNDFAYILGEFSGSWRHFLDKALDFQAALIKEKLEVLARLAREEEAWHKTLDETNKANLEVTQILPPVQAKIDKALEESHKLHAQALSTFALYRAQAETAERELEGLCSQVERIERQARQMHERVEEKEADYRQRAESIGELRDALLDFHQRLTAHRNGFQTHLDALDQELATVTRTRDELAAALKKAAERVAEWKQAIADGNKQVKEVEKSFQTAAKEIRALDEQQKKQDERAKQLAQHAQQAIAEIQSRQEATHDEREVVRKEIQRLKDEVAILEREQTELAKEQQMLEKAKKIRSEKTELVRQAALHLDQTIQAVRIERDAELAALVSDWQQVAATLDRLSDLEIALQPFGSLREAIKLRSGSTSIYHRFRSLAGASEGNEFWAQLTEADLIKQS